MVVCGLTTNLHHADAYGNVLPDEGEGNLPRQSAVIVSKVSAAKKTELGEYIGTLSNARVIQIPAGVRFQQRSFQR